MRGGRGTVEGELEGERWIHRGEREGGEGERKRGKVDMEDGEKELEVEVVNIFIELSYM